MLNLTFLSRQWQRKVRASVNAWDDIRVPVNATRRGGSKDPGFAQFKDNGSGSQGVFSYLFDAGNEEELYFSIQVPHNWRYGTDLRGHVHWCPINTDAGNVVWGLEYSMAKIGSVFPNTTLTTGTGAAATTAYEHTLTEVGDIDMSAVDNVSSMVLCRVYRDAANAADTYASDAALLEIDFHYQIDSLGSRDEYLK